MAYQGKMITEDMEDQFPPQVGVTCDALSEQSQSNGTYQPPSSFQSDPIIAPLHYPTPPEHPETPKDSSQSKDKNEQIQDRVAWAAFCCGCSMAFGCCCCCCV